MSVKFTKTDFIILEDESITTILNFINETGQIIKYSEKYEIIDYLPEFKCDLPNKKIEFLTSLLSLGVKQHD